MMMYPAFISTPSSREAATTTPNKLEQSSPSPIPISLLSIFGSSHQPFSNSLSYGSSNRVFGQAYVVESSPKLEALKVSPSPDGHLQPQRVFAPIFTTAAPQRGDFLENTATVAPTTTTTTLIPTTISEMTTTTSMYYTSVSLSQSQSVSTSVVKPAWARRLVIKGREEKEEEDLVTSESVPKIQLHSVVTMVYPGVYNTAASNRNRIDASNTQTTTNSPTVFNTAAINNREKINTAYTHLPIGGSTLATTEPTTIAIVPTTYSTTASTTTTSTTASFTTTTTSTT